MTTRATEDFLVHLEQRLALSEGAAVATLASWLLSYEPGPRACALRSGGATGAALAKCSSAMSSDEALAG